ncbi:head-tail connector protein [Pseudomonas aeruginosa]|uniref:head-tail connector protein n=1 Tax=Pseudomonas aeruginosa TaxID=287 RepID=UPI002A6B600A|nr:head-tail connector protein [Pseudomonas aeruginosa]MDY1146664.1 head-tail connector protein [Pseudomonas aeruginosa]MDY1207986.1 head-tail connector protein [Pseudomonas aeruginosa]
MMYVTLERAKAHLNMDHDEDDILIEAYVQAASGAVKNYLKSGSPYELGRDSNDNPVLDSNGDPTYELDSNGDKIVRAEVQSAVLLMVGHLYKDRDENPDSAFEQGYLPKPVTALLYPLRDPALR